MHRKTQVLPYQTHADWAPDKKTRCVKLVPGERGRDTDILKKASLALCFGYLESGKFIKYQSIAARDAHGMYLCARIARNQYTYGVGFGVVVWYERQYQSLR